MDDPNLLLLVFQLLILFGGKILKGEQKRMHMWPKSALQDQSLLQIDNLLNALPGQHVLPALFLFSS